MSDDRTQKLKELFGGLFAKLMEFSVEQEFLNSLGESLEIFYDLKPEEEYEFNPTDEQICKALEDTSLNLLEVRGCVPGKSLTLRDAFTGETFEVEESMGNGDVAEIGNLLFTRVLKLGDQHFLVGAGIFLDKSLKEYITQDFTKAYQQACEEGDHRSFKDFLKTNGFLLNHWIRAYEKGELTENTLVDEDKPDDGEDDDDEKK